MSSLEVAGWAVLSAGGLGFGLQLFRQWSRLRQATRLHERELDLFGEKIAALRAARLKVEQDTAPWNGTRKFQIQKKQQEKGGVCSFYLAPHDAKLPLPSFKPGQFLTLKLQINGKPVTRCYSLSDSPHSDHYRISVKRLPPPPKEPTAPPGLVSCYLHDEIEEGDILDLLAPRGNFAIDPTEGGRPVVLSGAGVGITPVLSMMLSLVAARSRRETWFFYGVRNGSENMLEREIAEWRALELPNFHIHVCYSNPLPEDEEGKDYDHEGRVGVDLFKQLLPSNNYDYFTCGPGPMMGGIRDGLVEWDVPDEQIHDEAFIAQKKKVEVSAASVTFKRTEKTLDVSGSATNLLDLASDEGIDIPSGCCAGSCGTCQTAILSGKVKYDQKPEFPVEAGSCLPCICLPDGDLELDA